eukprot:TRINITY_DN959_c0_g1_i18.p1 TRINITY_DN959_c0_g1~~TRINITY_DN959_c0_g1_i18.p1  ORF type:complete len:458 (+),score=69.80 TRINITY_DN959_c0_g1_i18:111-1376(+)
MGDYEGKQNKIFVGGISWDTTDAGFTSFFSRFGEIKDAVVMRDRVTGASRGFGFVTFADPSSVDKVLAQDLKLDGRVIDCKIAIPRGQVAGKSTHRTKKIFVGGVSPKITQEEFKEHFAQYGGVTDAVIMIDHDSGRSRGFGFVTFDSEETVEQVLSKTHVLGDKQVECKKALPKAKMMEQRFERGAALGYGAVNYSYGYEALPGGYYDPYGYTRPAYRESDYYGTQTRADLYGYRGRPTATTGGYSGYGYGYGGYGTGTSGYGGYGAGTSTTATSGGYGGTSSGGGYGATSTSGGYETRGYDQRSSVTDYGTTATSYTPTRGGYGAHTSTSQTPGYDYASTAQYGTTSQYGTTPQYSTTPQYGSTPPTGYDTSRTSGYGASPSSGTYGTQATATGYGTYQQPTTGKATRGTERGYHAYTR